MNRPPYSHLLFRRKRRRPNAFTVSELLTVAVILAALAALALPVYHRMSEMLKTTKCATNLRQIGAATLQMIADQNGMIRFQIGGGELKYGWTRRMVKENYIDQHAPYRYLRCPTVTHLKYKTDKYKPGKPDSQTAWYWETYGMNMFPVANSKYVPAQDGDYTVTLFVVHVQELRAPDFLLLSDSSMGEPDHYQTHSMKKRDGNTGGLALRHERRANAFFLDGHMEQVDAARAAATGIPTTHIYEVQ